MSGFFKKLSICMEKHSEKGVGGGGLGDCTVWVEAKDLWLWEEESDLAR